MENNKPQVRFKGFDEDWENHHLKSLCENIEYGLNAASKPYDGTNKYLRITDIDDETRTFLGNDVTSPNLDLSESSNFLLQKGDVLFARTGASVGKSYHYKEKDGKIYYAGFLIRVRIKKEINSELIFQYSLTDKFNKFVRITSQRSGQPGINAQEYGGFSFHLPKNKNEQLQLGTFFENLDKLISEHQQKHNKLKALKKAMLSKMFPQQGKTVPEIRFKGFLNDWVIKRLGDTRTYFTDGNYGEAYPTSKDLTDSENGVPFLRGSNLSNGILSKIGANYITYSKHLELVSGHLQEDDIVIAVRGSLGSLGYVGKNNIGWNINSQLAIIRTYKEELNGLFLIQYLSSDFGQRIINSKCTGTALKQLPIGKLKEVDIALTSPEEQQKIGDYFKNIDHLISNQQIQIQKLQNIKKAFLAKMFI